MDFGIGSDAAIKELATCRGLAVDLVSALLSGICIAAYPTAFLAAGLIPFGVPWFLLILCGSFWGFTSQPESLGRHSLSPGGDAAIWLLIALAIGLALSYTVVFQAGKFAGLREVGPNSLLTNACQIDRVFVRFGASRCAINKSAIFIGKTPI